MSPRSYDLEIICDGQVAEPAVLSRAQKVTIGRGEESDLVLPDPHLSRRHLALTLDPGGELWACDLGGKNPTELNGRPFRESLVAAGDVLTAGKCRIIIREGHRSADGSSTIEIEDDDPERPPEVRFQIDARNRQQFLSSETASAIDRSQLEAIYRLAENVVGTASRESTLGEIERAIEDVLDFDRYFIATGDPENDTFEVLRVVGPAEESGQIHMSQTILDDVKQQRKAVLVDDVASHITSPSDSIRSLGITSFMCSPMLAAGEFMGILYVDRVNADQSFEAKDLEYLQGVAHLASLAMSELALRDRIETDNIRLRRVIARKQGFVAHSTAMLEVLSRIERYAKNQSPVLVLGETGTGKEHIARMLHDGSGRCKGPFVAFNCALSTPAMVESELFGHVQGAFTGADADRKGRFQLADGGTLFLDEIGDMPGEVQAKLLRVLQENKVWPVGSEKAVPVDIRLISATHQKLAKLRKSGDFRDDLYYRIAALTVDVPPLSRRENDVILIAESLLSEPMHLATDAKAALRAYSWPGNVRELENVMEQARCTCRGHQIRLTDLPAEIAREGRRSPMAVKLKSLRHVEAKHITAALDAVRGNKRRAAELLGISRNTLYQKIQLYGL